MGKPVPTSPKAGKARDALPVVGLENQGNTCFLNSTLQALLSLPPFVSWFRDEAPQSSDMPLHASLRAFLRAARDAEGGGEACLRPSALLAALVARAPRFKGRGQQDAQEAVRRRCAARELCARLTSGRCALPAADGAAGRA